MKYQVHMLAFNPKGTVRDVEIPSDITNLSETELLDEIFHWGQNDFQPQECYSVSVGDVIELDGKFFMVHAVGFKELSVSEFEQYDGCAEDPSIMAALFSSVIGTNYDQK